MKRTIFILAAIMLDVALIFAQDDNTTLLDYLVNPTQQEREMFKDLNISQIDTAIELYDSNALVEQLHNLTQEIKNLDNELEDVRHRQQQSQPVLDSIRFMITNQIQLLRMTGERKNIDRVLKMVRQIIDDDPSDISFMKPYLDILFQLGEWEECERVLNLFEANCKNEYDLARITQNKATVANAKDHIPESISQFHKALDTYNKYIAEEGYGYKGVATKTLTSCNVLSQLYYKIEEKDSCMYYMNSVLELGTIASAYDSIDAPLVYASACNSIANKLNSYGYSERSDSVYNVVYKYLEKAYQKAPFRNGSTYAFYHMNHARDFLAKENIDSAIVNSDKALEVMTRLYRVFPKWSAVNYFEALRLRAELYTISNQYEESRDMLIAANEELDEIEMDSPGSNAMRYYFLYYDIAANEAGAEHCKEALSYFEKAKDVIKELDPRFRDRCNASCDKYIEMCRECLKTTQTLSLSDGEK